ncbi:hypothetical protein A2230_08430 [candidate division WOR-1 bacterium RIFOXYA2_FULL_36_21]|uniref:Sulfatase N-terminal domain-containing protein n=1 Tax=candidate division WOR-1 bacterium RIFOXYB2_FULL_36_35 TaxID=1802578 RepID=A0A1F4S8C4_UNCSA|nr:MAG: hypothetical protein A2230_08430 [candidate division WOR-1 bacterium RIFOXYA2_FULL_36_21]OGC15334.1 MAG: hypothetical protein A2282_06180 [candidate division WOR-1 bacterium RIFOXYA12_FULL_36_13]OGC16676.1 MAG: hypothetical protein A2290_03645 [candidate division WOR-1 bacterium RIFOXYB2_FULL_36_35]
MKKIIIYPFVFAVYPVLFLFFNNLGELGFFDVFPKLLFFIFIYFLLWVVLFIVLRNLNLASVISSVLFLWIFLYGSFCFLFSNLLIEYIFIRERFLLAFWVFVLVCLFVALMIYFRRNKQLEKINYFFNVVAFVLVLGLVFNFLSYKLNNIHKRVDVNALKSVKKMNSLGFIFSEKSKKRDVYYIILDAYSSDSVLKGLFGYDNSSFTNSLKKRGFYVADKSFSNYAFTLASLSSSLNMTYLDFVGRIMGQESNDISYLQEMMKNAVVEKTFAQNGYEIINIGSWWKATSSTPSTASFMDKILLDEFNMLLLESSIFHPFSIQITFPVLRCRVIDQFKEIEEVSNNKNPTFVFAHILSPHPPFIFNSNGSKLKLPKGVAGWFDHSLYVPQLRFINKKVMQLVDSLLSKSKVKPIIIIQGDHGAGYLFEQDIKNKPTDIRNKPKHMGKLFSDANLKGQMRILNAYYLPDVEFVNTSISPVNTFRLIFNWYFGGNFQILEDKSYFSSYFRPYKFINVTEKVKY